MLRFWQRQLLAACVLLGALSQPATLAAAEPATGVTSGDATEPAGYVVPVPVRGWAAYGKERTTETVGYLMVPEVLDTRGTVTIILKGVAINQIAIRKSDVPDDLHFLFGNSGELYANVRRSVDAIYGKPANISVELTYDKSAPPRLEQTYRLVDAAGNVPDAKVTAHYNSPFSPGAANIELTPDENGVFAVPRVQGLPDLSHLPPVARRLPQVALTIQHASSGQQFQVNFSERITTEPVAILLPVAGDDAAATSVTRVSGKIVNAHGTPAAGATLRFPMIRYRPGLDQDVDDTTTITVLTANPRADGTFDLAVNPDFNFMSRQSESIPVTVTEPVDGLFESLSFQLKPGEDNTIQFPERLSVTAQLFDRQGQPVNPDDSKNPGSWIGLEVQMVDGNGKVLETDHTNIDPKETTNSLFVLQNLPAPGRYMIKHNSLPYGPVDLGETSPTEVVRFNEPATLGVRHGLVTDENGKPLAGALVVLSKDNVRERELAELAALVEEITGADKAAGLDRLTSAVDSVVDYAITTGSGEYVFPRNVEGQQSYITLAAVAPGRVGATLYDSTNAREMLPTQNYELPPARLPRTIMATGVVHAPEQIPDPENLGQLKPMPEGLKYRVYWWDTRGWFKPQSDMRWQYGAPSREFAFGTPFEYPVPLGTSFTVGAIPADDDIHLSLQLWKEGPAAPGDEPLQLEPATLRALQPFWLELKYPNSQPAAGVSISSLYGTRNRVVNGRVIQPQTDENGRYLLYGDEGLAPQMNVYGQPGMGFRQQMFKIQPLDMSTSVPTLTLTLDPKIWGHDGRNAR